MARTSAATIGDPLPPREAKPLSAVKKLPWTPACAGVSGSLTTIRSPKAASAVASTACSRLNGEENPRSFRSLSSPRPGGGGRAALGGGRPSYLQRPPHSASIAAWTAVKKAARPAFSPFWLPNASPQLLFMAITRSRFGSMKMPCPKIPRAA